MDASQRALLAHFLRALRYRTRKALLGADPGFGAFIPPGGGRTPAETVRHMTTVLQFACALFSGERRPADPLPDLAAEVLRLESVTRELAGYLDAGSPVQQPATAERLLQGPFADAMTHVGQLAMLRRIAGSPVPPQDFFSADLRGE